MARVALRVIASLFRWCILVVAVAVSCIDEVAAATTTITNTTAQPLSYRARYPDKPWSDFRTLAPGKTDRYNSPNNILVELRAGDGLQSWNLIAGKSYEYAMQADRSGKLFESDPPTPARPATPAEPAPAASATPSAAPSEARATPAGPFLPAHAGDLPLSVKFPPREFTILAVADRTYRQRHPQWQDRVKQIVERTSQYYSEVFNMRFSVADFQPWQLKADAKNFADTWNQLYGIDARAADLVVGFVGVAYPQGHRFGGYRLGQAMPMSQHVYISDEASLELAVRTLVHELGHIFGAFHVADTRSIMYPEANRVASYFEFGKPVIEAFQHSQDLDLRRGVESLSPDSARAIEQLQATYGHPRELEIGNPVAAGFAYQSLRADAIGDPIRAKSMAKRAVECAPKNPLPYSIWGALAQRQGHFVEAEKAFRQVTVLDEKNAWAWAMLSHSLLDLADVEAGGAAAEHACELAMTPQTLNAKVMAEFLSDNQAALQRDLEVLRRMAPPLAVGLEARIKTLPRKQLIAEHAIREMASHADVRKNSLGMAFILLRPDTASDQGRFQMGSVPDEKWRSPGENQHQVQLTHAFCLGQTEVTQHQFEQVMGLNPSHFGHRDEDLPVENVTWEEAVTFCQRLSEMTDERQQNRRYRLPTEAEWEYACRAGSAARYHYGDEDAWLRRYAWFVSSQSDIRTLAVGQKAPNRWGFYDMLGNVAEWCSDWYADLRKEEQVDPTGPPTGNHHVIRGGSWSLANGPPRSAARGELTFQQKSDTVGFRVVLEED